MSLLFNKGEFSALSMASIERFSPFARPVPIIAIPLFASLIRKRVHFPWFLWAFLAAGLAGTLFYANTSDYFKTEITPYLKIAHVSSWSIAMAAIGLNAERKNAG